MGMPFARQERDWYRMGLVLPRADMANRKIRCCLEWLTPVYDRIHEILLECQALHMDETRIQWKKERRPAANRSCGAYAVPSAKRFLLLISTIPVVVAARLPGSY